MRQAMSSGDERRTPSVLVVDDEPTIGEILSRYLQRSGYHTRIAYDGAQALAMSAERRTDLVILDIMLPGCDGLEVMRRLHESEDASPAVILLTAKGQESDRIVGLRRGADDYVVKPFSPNEIVARVEAVLRRGARPSAAEVIQAGELRIDAALRTVDRGESEVNLTQRELDLLIFLARHPGRIFSRDQLMESVWELPYYSDSSTVTVHIRRLRAKIEPDPANPHHIQTVWGVGYRFAP
jgi:DNA-binding response OmpR family regulator